MRRFVDLLTVELRWTLWRLQGRPGAGPDWRQSRTVRIETAVGRRRRAWLAQIAANLPAPPAGWSWADTDTDAVAWVLQHHDGRTLRLQLGPRQGPAYRHTACFAVSHSQVPLGDAERAWLDLAADAIASSEAALAQERGFPASLFDRRPAHLAVDLATGLLELRPSLACNHSCTFCNSIIDEGAQNPGNGIDDALAVLAEIDHLPLRRIVLSGGEPTLLPGLADLVRVCAQRGRSVTLQTNAMALGDFAYTTRLRRAGLQRVLISLHSHDAERSDREITRFAGGWARTVAGIDAAVACGLEVELSHVLHRANAKDCLPFMEFVHARWGRQVTVLLAFVAPTGAASGADPAVLPPMADVLDSLRAALDFARRHRVRAYVLEHCAIPPCLLRGYERFSNTLAVREGVDRRDHIQLDACLDCAYRGRCSGLWTRYYQTWGDPGLRTVHHSQRWKRVLAGWLP